MKKLALSTLALATAFALTAGTTLAFGMPNHYTPKKDPAPKVKVENKNMSIVKTEVKSEADTGDNKIITGNDHKKPQMPVRTYGHSYNNYNKSDSGEADIDTGKAESYAGAEVYVGDNYTEVDAPYKTDVYVKNGNYSYVNTYVKSEAESGDNTIYSRGGEAEIETGDADSGASAFVVVGSNVTKIE